MFSLDKLAHSAIDQSDRAKIEILYFWISSTSLFHFLSLHC